MIKYNDSKKYEKTKKKETGGIHASLADAIIEIQNELEENEIRYSNYKNPKAKFESMFNDDDLDKSC